MTIFRRIPPLYAILTGVYLAWAAALYRALPLGVYPDSQAYLTAAQLDPLSGEFWSFWRAASFPLLWRMAGYDAELVALAQTIFYVLAWLSLAALVAKQMTNPRLAVLAFASLLGFSLNIDVFVWNRAALTESLDVTLTVFALCGLLIWQRTILSGHTPRPARQIALAIPAAGLVFLWGFSRPANYYILAGLVLVLLALVAWQRGRMWAWRYALGLLIVAAAGTIAYRYWNVEQTDLTELTIMQKMTSEVLLEPDQTAFFIERGMPSDPEALSYAGWVPPRYRGDWYAVFGEWLEAHGRRTLIEFTLLHPRESLLEPLLEWQKIVDPNMMLSALGRNPNFHIAEWRATHSHLIYNPSAVGYALLGGLALVLMGSLVWGGRAAPSAWLIPLLMILVGAGWGVWNWNFNHYEERQLLLLSLLLRLGMLWLALVTADHLLRHAGARWAVLGLGALILLEALLGWGPTHNAVYRALAPAAPHTNWLASWDVSEHEYEVFQHIPLDETALHLRTDIIDGEVYSRLFTLRWGEFDLSGELIAETQNTFQIVWRNDPRLDSAVGPLGPVYGPVPYGALPAPERLREWQTTRLPAHLQANDLRYIMVDARTWQTLPRYEAALLRHPDLYRMVQRWPDGATLLEAHGVAATWADLAPGTPATAGLSPARYADFQGTVPPVAGPILAPDTGPLADRAALLLRYGGLTEVILHSDPTAQAALFSLLATLQDVTFGPEARDPAALEAWRGAKTPANLRAAGYDYLLVNDAWWGWLTAEEQARFQNPAAYTLVQEWRGVIPGWYRLYRIQG